MTIFELLLKNKHSFQHVLGWKRNGRLFHLNLQEYKEQIEIHISILNKLGVSAGSKVGIVAQTSLEWHLFDMASMAMGAIVVPIYTNFTRPDLITIQKALNIHYFILGNERLIDKFDVQIFKDKTFLVIEEEARGKSGLNLCLYKDILSNLDPEVRPLEDYVSNLMPDDTCSYLLTSGTTGLPKISIITHKNLFALLENIQFFMKDRLKVGSRSLTTLPLAHVLGRCDSLLHIILPVQTVFGESIDSIVSDLQIIKPTYLVTVPRLIAKLKEKILQNIKSKGSAYQTIFNAAISFSEYFYDLIEKGKEPKQFEKIIFLKLQKSVLSKVRDQISPEIKFFVSGGAPLKDEDFKFFKNLGLPILEGYGLTETLGPVTLNAFGSPEKGSVGLPFKDIVIKIDEDGEILISGPSVFQGYLNDDGSVDDSSFTNGFFRTGDIGEILPSGNLKITDRKKDIIVTSNGKNISPQKIEALMSTSPRIEHFMTVGEGHSYLTGLVSITKDGFNDLIDQGVIDVSISYEEMAKNPTVKILVQSEIERLNSELPGHEQIKKFTILPLNLNGDSDYLTPSLKIKRDRIYNKYIKDIDAMYPRL